MVASEEYEMKGEKEIDLFLRKSLFNILSFLKFCSLWQKNKNKIWIWYYPIL